MTTAAQIKRALRPLLERHGDLALMSPWIILKPMNHIVRTVLLDRTSEKNRFRLAWTVMHLFDHRRHISLQWGSGHLPPHMFAPERRGWDWQRDDLQSDLIATIEDVLPKLRKIETIWDVVALNREICLHQGVADRMTFYERGYSSLVIFAALGRFDLIDDKTKASVERLNPDGYDRKDDWEKQRVAFLRQLLALVTANDRAGVAAHLHDQERRTVERLKLTHLWEPTPFPVEEDGAASLIRPG